MLKVLHFADLHLGVENYGKLNSKTGLNSRVEDFLAAFDSLVETGLKEKVDLVIFAGDAFRDRNPSPTLQREFAKRISKFIHAGIPVVLLVGNHDLPRMKNRANTLEIYKVLDIPGLTVIDQTEIVKIKTGKGYVQIAGIPWDYFLNLFLALKAEQKNGDKDKKEDLKKLLEEQIKAKIKDFAEKIDSDLPSILTAHLPLGIQFGSEQELEIELDVFLKPEVVINSDFDYIALGHMHKFQELSKEPLAIYPGSLEKVDFGEKKQKKGFVIIDLPQKKDKEGIGTSIKPANHKFYPTSKRKFIELEFNLEKLKDPNEILTEIEKQKTKLDDAIVKIILTGTKSDLNQLDHSRLNELLKSTHDYIPSTKLVDRKKARSELTVEVTPLKALEEYLKLTKTPKDKAGELKKRAQELIKEIEN
ncbi:exonuclease SbcCD subunit D [Patescibacteria group bacterium]